uniref:Uncharacterized protein n=1 Tax=Cacopsylla melanoneura TaxID=428564 RepID=A0A8D8RX23_9HEMI
MTFSDHNFNNSGKPKKSLLASFQAPMTWLVRRTLKKLIIAMRKDNLSSACPSRATHLKLEVPVKLLFANFIVLRESLIKMLKPKKCTMPISKDILIKIRLK